MHFKELIAEVMRVKAINQDNPGRMIAQMHTEINLDSRFLHHGGGEWGLREWVPKQSKIVKIRPETPSPSVRARPSLRDDEEEEDEAPEDEDDAFSGDDLDEDEDTETEEYDDDDDDAD